MKCGNVLVCGNIVTDLLVRPVEEIQWNTTRWVDSIEQHLGGNGANTAYTLAMLAVPVRLLGAVGPDGFGDFALSQLQRAGVDLTPVRRDGAATATTVGLVRADGARAFLHRPGASHQITAPLPWPEACGATTHFHLANIFGLPNLRPHAAETLRQARKLGYSTSLDTGWDARNQWSEILNPCLPYLDLLFVNQDEARLLTGLHDPAQAARALLDGGAGTVIVKLGEQGCLVCRGQTAEPTPAFIVPVVDTTGAGDCFAGGFISGLHHGYDLVQAARLANAAGALSVQRLGAITGLLPLDQTLDWMKARSS